MTQVQGVIPLDRPRRITIGSAPGSDLGSGNPTIEPAHGEIQVGDSGIMLVPFGKGNTSLNDAAIEGSIQLAVGDRIRIGSLHVRLTPRGLEYDDASSEWLVERRRARGLPEDLLGRLKQERSLRTDRQPDSS